MKRLLKDPVLIFFVLGALLFVLFGLLQREESTPIVLSNGAQALLVSEWEMLTGRSADSNDVQRIVEDYYERELLFREGLSRELYASDPSIRELIIELMQQQVTGEILEPSGKDLVNFYTDNIDRYYSEATISFTQRLFRDAPQAPDQLLAQLNQGDVIGDDQLWQGKDFPNYGVSMIRGLFGQSLLEVLEEISIAEWQGPYQSAEGWHYFRVERRDKPVLLSFERVKDQVMADYQAEAVSAAVEAFVETKRAAYPLETGSR
ncbi:peptidylprolyl isomerase [Congregibacter variabilis]|uniref:Peptidylprolyl isomerase n=1 Tax=Congregibacter variabilis TaxID=3081200 RepID=A0ABZ0I4X1_9GAMM|nr:peptidylprolyl isomerase [Congregibacter sp. IMCC43200]